jgi:hypothetical protein
MQMCHALRWLLRGGMALLHCALVSVGKKKEKVKCGITYRCYTMWRITTTKVDTKHHSLI